MKKIILIGGGSHCKACIDVIEQENKFNIAGVLDLPDKLGRTILGYPIIGTDNDLPTLAKKYHYYLITIGQVKSAKIRVMLYEKLKQLGKRLPTIISPQSYTSKHSLIGEGNIIMHHATVNVDVKIGNNCIINSKALIEHDALIGDNCHISTGSIVNGGVKVGNNCLIGSGSVLKNGIEISENTIIGSGSSIVHSITKSGTYVGSPAKKIEE